MESGFMEAFAEILAKAEAQNGQNSSLAIEEDEDEKKVEEMKKRRSTLLKCEVSMRGLSSRALSLRDTSEGVEARHSTSASASSRRTGNAHIRPKSQQSKLMKQCTSEAMTSSEGSSEQDDEHVVHRRRCRRSADERSDADEVIMTSKLNDGEKKTDVFCTQQIEQP
eukprot:scaffold19247_cov122-Skeletonema_dohrnii-CCMP3373.AAC.1